MKQPGRKNGASVFILLIPKWTRVKDPDEIKKKMNSTSSISANAHFSDSNWLKILLKNTPLSQMLNVEQEELGDLESVAGSQCNLKLDKEVDFFLGFWLQMLIKIGDSKKKNSRPI